MQISIAILLFGLFFGLLILEVPVALSLALPALSAIVLFNLEDPILIAQQIFSAFDSYNLLAIPLFLFAGHLLGECALSRRLLDFVLITLGRARGGVAVVTVVSLLSRGSPVPARLDVAALGVLLFPCSRNPAFSESLSGALLAAGRHRHHRAAQHRLILYGVVAETSISRLFLAGVLPGRRQPGLDHRGADPHAAIPFPRASPA